MKYVKELEQKVLEHFVVEHMVGGYIFRSLYMLDDPRYDGQTQHKVPHNTHLFETVMPEMFGKKGLVKTAFALDQIRKFSSDSLINTYPVAVFKYLLRVRMSDLLKVAQE